MKHVTISNRSEVKDSFLGIKSRYNSEESYTETVTYICGVCGEKDQHLYHVTDLLHTPTTIRKAINEHPFTFRQIEWGYGRYSIWVCSSHTVLEIDKTVAKLKKKEAQGGE